MDRDEVWIRRRKEYLESVSKQPILPGVVNYLDAAKGLGIKLAVASSSPENWVRGHLTRLELFEHFSTIKTADDVSQTKPAPDLFNAVLKEFSLEPTQAIVLEDSPNGILASKAAGIYCVAVPNPLTTQLKFDQADLTLKSLADLSLEKLLEKAGA
jgi:HAD superfamily hydrolase (TIGR01509 family)